MGRFNLCSYSQYWWMDGKWPNWDIPCLWGDCGHSGVVGTGENRNRVTANYEANSQQKCHSAYEPRIIRNRFSFPRTLNGTWHGCSQGHRLKMGYGGRSISNTRCHSWVTLGKSLVSLSPNYKIGTNNGFSRGSDITVYAKCFVSWKALNPGRLLCLFLRTRWDFAELQTAFRSLACFLKHAGSCSVPLRCR